MTGRRNQVPQLVPHDDEYALHAQRHARRFDFEAAFDAAQEIDDPRVRAGARAIIVKRLAEARNYPQAREEASKISDPAIRTLAHLSIARVTGSTSDFAHTLSAAEAVSGRWRNAILQEIANSLAEANCFLFAKSVAEKIDDQEKSSATRKLIDLKRQRSRILGR